MTGGPPPVERALSFGSAAGSYERHRPGYPDALVDLVLQHARRPVRTALEVGAGTGKATRLFAARGIDVCALEPDPAMAEVLVATTRGLPVRPVVATLEAYTGSEPVDLLYAAAAWHWTDPATRWTRAVDLLAPGGVLALFGRPTDPVSPEIRAAIEEIQTQVLPATPAGHAWSVDDVAATPGLEDVVERDLPAVTTMAATDVIGLLGTVSGYLVLTPEARADALARVRAVLPERIEVDVTTRVCLARRC